MNYLEEVDRISAKVRGSYYRVVWGCHHNISVSENHTLKKFISVARPSIQKVSFALSLLSWPNHSIALEDGNSACMKFLLTQFNEW